MVSSANTLSNKITTRIMHEVTNLYVQKLGADEKKITSHPSYYMIRHLIEQVLSECVQEVGASYDYSPYEIERMSGQKDYWNHVHRRLAVRVGEMIFESGLYNKIDFESESGYFGSKTFRVFVLDAEKIEAL